LANTISPSVCGGDAALCQITLTICLTCCGTTKSTTNPQQIGKLHIKSATFSKIIQLAAQNPQQIKQMEFELDRATLCVTANLL